MGWYSYSQSESLSSVVSIVYGCVVGASAIGSSDICGGGRGIAPSIVNDCGLRDGYDASGLVEHRAKA